MDLKSLQEQLKLKYTQDNWKDWLKDIFGSQIQFELQPETIVVINGKAKKIERFAAIALSDYKNIAVLDILTSKEIQISRNRVALREIGFNLIDQAKYHGLLVFYHSEDDKQSDYRLSFIYKQTVIDEEGNLSDKSTNPKRYSFILGENESCYTPAQRLINLKARIPQFIAFENNVGITLKDLTETFSVEALNNEFFKKYKDIHYRRLWEHIADNEYYRTLLINNDEENEERKLKPIRDFAKKMLGRIVFLHFLQKKGWMGCPANTDEWKGGDKQFMQSLFANYPNQEHFYSQCLTILFFEVLNARRVDDLLPHNLLYKGSTGNSTASFKVPFLNGGLFDNDLEATNHFDFPVTYFHDLFEFFSQYNFTIDENSPDEQEVGIDPEMLGHIFENLLEENKDKGAFYTPKEIVHYMCQESLIQYLRAHLPECAEDDSTSTIALENFIRKDIIKDRHDKNNFIVAKAKRIEYLLDNVKICDPAIGSGAFPMGMLQEIFKAKTTLDLTLDPAKVKKDIIQNSIYGVDLESGAVDIARLRFWLSLVVDEEVPQPLPNLDYKIMQGNSLLERFEDTDLSRVHMISRTTVLVEQERDLFGNMVNPQLQITDNLILKQNDVQELMAQFFDEDNPVMKVEIKGRINQTVHDHIDYNLELRLNALTIQIADAPSLDNPTLKIPLRKKVEKLHAELEKLYKTQENLHNLQNKTAKPYYLWHLFFADVFENGGFDIVIGNPPYLRIQGIREVDPKFADQLCELYQSATGSFDLFVTFVEKSLEIINPNGIVNFIMPVKWTNGAFGKGLRGIVAENKSAYKIINFGAYQVFNASTYTGLHWFKRNSENLSYVELDRDLETNQELENYLSSLSSDKFALINSNKLDKEDSWVLTVGNTTKVLESIGTHNRTFKDVFEKVFQGLATSKDDVYFLYSCREFNQTVIGFSKQLNKEIEIERELIKPLLKGEDVHRYDRIYSDRFVIFPYKIVGESASLYTEDELFNLFPLGYSYLKECEDILREREKGRLRNDEFWYRYIYPKNLVLFAHEKLVAPEISLGGNFAYDIKGEFYATTKIYGYIKKSTIEESYKFWLGLCNSKLFWFFLQNTGYVLRGGYFTFKTDYVNPFPVPESINPVAVRVIENCVDYIHILKNKETPGLSHFVSNDFIIRQFEDVIDGCVYEIYFEKHMKDRRIDIVQSANEILISIEKEIDLQKKYKSVQDVFNRLQNTDNDVRSRLELFVHKSPEYLKTIIQS